MEHNNQIKRNNMKLPFKEPTAPSGIYINPETNIVHLLMQIMSGAEIGLDNTCKSVYSLQEFFGLLGANKQNTALMALTDYKAALEFDLKYMPDSIEKTRKTQRLAQIEIYLDIVKQIQQDKRTTKSLKRSFPLYPEPLETLMRADDANLHSIILRPVKQDVYLRTTAIAPTFSVNHDFMRDNGQIVRNPSSLAETLQSQYQSIVFKPKSQEGLIESFLANPKNLNLAVDFDKIRTALIAEITTYLGITVKFDETQGDRHAPAVPMNQPYIDKELGVTAKNPAKTEEYVNALIQYCTPNLFDNIEVSPFYTVNEAERLSILTQFFLAELNIACSEQGITVANFGKKLEDDTELAKNLTIVVKEALEHSASVEDALIQYINTHKEQFELKELIAEKGIPTLKKRFKSHWEQIKKSPHFDEFMLLGEKSGLFVTHQNFIAIHFANFLQIGWQDSRLDAAIKDFYTVDKPGNVIPHKNDHIHADIQEIEIDLSQMGNDALQALYEDINTYPEKVKDALLAQFKADRPDLKLKIDTQKFLQHVAYGEQNEAEALLQQDPELATALLQAYDIPFTDYSGRTFTCTAYEYAHWAKDGHMQHMLAKYIRQDEETRIEMLHRVSAIEELMNPSPAAGFLAPPRPKGLCYTTQDKAGNTINHRDAHFDLTPLISALRYYAVESNKMPNTTEAELERLNKIWVEVVGREQRMLPAHIVHEYCHPDRSFEDVNDNNDLLNAANPGNLKRQLKFYNNDTCNYDIWFSPRDYSVDSGLGFSLGILRCSGRTARGWKWGCSEDAARDDADTLTTIDKVRTNDCQQSQLNLSQPLNSPLPLS